jgi:hypothetical protein
MRFQSRQDRGYVPVALVPEEHRSRPAPVRKLRRPRPSPAHRTPAVPSHRPCASVMQCSEPMVLMLSVHPSRTKHILTDPRIVASPGLPMPWPTNQDDRHRRSRRGARNRQAHAAPDKTDVIGRRVLSAQGRSPARRYCNYNSTLVPSFHDLIPLPYRVESTSFMVTGCQAFGSRCDSL